MRGCHLDNAPDAPGSPNDLYRQAGDLAWKRRHHVAHIVAWLLHRAGAARCDYPRYK